MTTQEIFKKIRKIEIKTKGLTSQVFSGGYKTTFKGRGMLFSEVRPYQYGDDVRNIDWNVTARTNEPYIKMFEEERELVIMLLIDMSASSFFGSDEQTKNEFAAEIAATLAFSAVNNNDTVGAIFFSDTVEKFFPPKKGKSHILQIIKQILTFEPQGVATDLNLALQYLVNVVPRRCTTFVLSDFLTQGYESAIRVAGHRHDLIGLHIFAPHEAELPKVGLLPAIDSETGQQIWVDTNSPIVQQQHRDFYQKNLAYFKQTFRQNNADTLSISTQDSYVKQLMEFFKSR
jgi:uncharacterized protein (DUF58 family)